MGEGYVMDDTALVNYIATLYHGFLEDSNFLQHLLDRPETDLCRMRNLDKAAKANRNIKEDTRILAAVLDNTDRENWRQLDTEPFINAIKGIYLSNDSLEGYLASGMVE